MIVKNLTFPDVFESFYDDFNKDFQVMVRSSRIFRAIACLSCICAFSTLIIVFKNSSRIKNEYRNILAVQLMLSCYGSILVTVVSPYFFAPYPAIFVTGPMAVDHRITLYLIFTILITYFLPTMILLSFGLIYNYVSLKQLHTQIFNISIDRFLKSMIFIFVTVMLTTNCILFISLYNTDQASLQFNIIKNVDFRVAPIFAEHAAFVFDMSSWPLRITQVQSIVMAFASVTFCVTLTVLSCKDFERQKPMLSFAASRNHRMMIYMLFSYVFHFLVYFSIPLILIILAVNSYNPVLGRYTYTLIMLPSHSLGVSLSITYCLIITPYRNVLLSFLFAITCSSNNQCYNSSRPTLQLSIIDSANWRRYSYRTTPST